MTNPIDERLFAPVRTVPIEELPRLWRHVEVAVTCAAPPIQTTRLDLLRKIRGALGDQLIAGASEPARRREPCDWDPPCARDVLFRHRSIPGVKAGAPHPFVLSADADGEQLTIRLTLFGIAESCAAEAAEALVRGLRAGLSLGDGWWIGFEPRHRSMRVVAGIEGPPPTCPEICLGFETPAAPRSEGKGAPTPTAALRGMFDRIVGLARWYSLEVTDGPDWLRGRLAAVTLDDSEFAAGDTEFRPSTRARGGGYHIEPAGGTLRITGEWLPLWPLLAIGEIIHAGGRATDGYGRFRLVPGG